MSDTNKDNQGQMPGEDDYMDTHETGAPEAEFVVEDEMALEGDMDGDFNDMDFDDSDLDGAYDGEYDDEFDDRRGLEAGRHERRVGFQYCVHPVVVEIVVYGAATAPAHRVCGFLRGIAVAGRALGDHAVQCPTT